MDKIAFIGGVESAEKFKTAKLYKIFITFENGGKLTWGANFRHTLNFGENEIAVVPPNTEFDIEFKSPEKALVITLEQALLPFKEPCVICDDEYGGLHTAALTANRYFGKDGAEGILQALGNLITAYTAAFARRENFSPVTETVRADILKNLSNPSYYLDGELKKLPLNYDYIRKLFKKETGVTPREFLTGKRMELAAELLRSKITNRYSKYTVSQVAEACGFSEPLYFSRVFKKYYGVAPSEYAQNL